MTKAGRNQVSLNTAQSLVGKRIAVVEDEAIVRIGIEQTVAEAGGTLAKSVSQHCDVAVLDVRLEHGQTVLSIALALARRGTPFLFYTGATEREIKALQRHFDETLVLRKPATSKQLLRAILATLSG